MLLSELPVDRPFVVKLNHEQLAHFKWNPKEYAFEKFLGAHVAFYKESETGVVIAACSVCSPTEQRGFVSRDGHNRAVGRLNSLTQSCVVLAAEDTDVFDLARDFVHGYIDSHAYKSGYITSDAF